jgi:hypothetical protein
MKALVLYCRWQGARLRLHGRDDAAVWGQLIFQDGNAESAVGFRFEFASNRLIRFTTNGEQSVILDEMGVIIGS